MRIPPKISCILKKLIIGSGFAVCIVFCAGFRLVVGAPNVSGTYRDAIESIALYQKLAKEAYDYSSSQSGLPSGYTLIYKYVDSSKGFQAKVYRSTGSNEVVVAFAGTQLGYDSTAEKAVRISQGTTQGIAKGQQRDFEERNADHLATLQRSGGSGDCSIVSSSKI